MNLNLNIKKQITAGIPSYCTANGLVIEAVFENALHSNFPVLIEGTANQINQYGGYTGMKPGSFREYVFKIADKVNFPKDKIILGGDHMGPLVWSSLSADEAMKKAAELVRLCVLSGFKKIHIDTSMKLGGEYANEKLPDDLAAERGAFLVKECEKAYQDLLKDNPDEIRPVYVIGSEVPVPGGVHDDKDNLQITKAADFENTLRTYRLKFDEYGISNLFCDVIGVVVQPGVEFSVHDVHEYNRDDAKELSSALKNYPEIVFEGHSTDYQTKEKLREMADDGVKILKVGPALTFALREGLFALSMIECEIFQENERANFIENLERVMLENPVYWEKHYSGSEKEKRISRKYSYSDRCRYYFSLPEIQLSIEKLFANIDSVNSKIPSGLLKQYMPVQYEKARSGELEINAASLAKDFVKSVADDYNYAFRH